MVSTGPPRWEARSRDSSGGIRQVVGQGLVGLPISLPVDRHITQSLGHFGQRAASSELSLSWPGLQIQLTMPTPERVLHAPLLHAERCWRHGDDVAAIVILPASDILADLGAAATLDIFFPWGSRHHPETRSEFPEPVCSASSGSGARKMCRASTLPADTPHPAGGKRREFPDGQIGHKGPAWLQKSEALNHLRISARPE